MPMFKNVHRRFIHNSQNRKEKNPKKTQCASTGKWINWVYAYNEMSQSNKIKEQIIYVTTWMTLTNVILSTISLIQKNIYDSKYI